MKFKVPITDYISSPPVYEEKVLADIAAQDAPAFAAIVEVAKKALQAKPAATLAKA